MCPETLFQSSVIRTFEHNNRHVQPWNLQFREKRSTRGSALYCFIGFFPRSVNSLLGQ